ncbi:hypothetical protein [Psychrosphaera aestuarii]|uniref:hypothetical protein n=1 Tax=Psychrosphaera aestuarii TaxID=1266052 RepID=UPI001B3203D0|nr:hypothetical protein [Psychrosphaera aestuarii]
MGFLKLITVLVAGVALAMSGYLYQLIDQTNFFNQSIEIPADQIWMYHLVAAIVIVWLVISLFLKLLPPLLIVGLLIVAVGSEGMFVGLNFNGTIVEQSEFMEKLENSAEDLMKKAEDLLDN